MSTAGQGAAEELARFQLADRIERLGDNIARRAMTIMYANPFWDDRFGTRGRRFAEEDGRHHVAYLCEALRQSDPRVMTRYARWLQSVLTTRGMCSAHLDENFERIAGIIRSESLPSAHVAIEFLEQGRRALCYEGGPARDIQDASDALGVATRNALDGARPGWRDRWGVDSSTRLAASVEWLVSYLADAVAHDRDDQLAGFIAWLGDFVARRGAVPDALASLLDALAGSLDRLPRDTTPHATAMLAAARARAAAMPSPSVAR
jgi:hypothetical protein